MSDRTFVVGLIYIVAGALLALLGFFNFQPSNQTLLDFGIALFVSGIVFFIEGIIKILEALFFEDEPSK